MTRGPLRRPQMYVRMHSEPGTLNTTPVSEMTPMNFDSEEEWDRFALNPVINGVQMRTLMDPVEHQEKVTHSIDVSGYSHSMNQMWESKEDEARHDASHYYVHGAGIYDWMEAGERQRTPIEIRVDPGEEGYGQGEGHHRAAAKAALQRERGEVQPVKFQATQSWRLGSEGGTRWTEDEDYEEYEPTPPPSSQWTTQRMATPANAQRLEPRTSRKDDFTWNPHLRPAGKVWNAGKGVYETPPAPPGIRVGLPNTEERKANMARGWGF